MSSRHVHIGIKHALDRMLALTLLVALSPLFALIAVLVRLDGEPVFFRQARVGRGGKPFVIWKFRTMIPDADRLLDAHGQSTGVGRITYAGRFLRMTSLDELPQLINILRGEMSFIGPRPGLIEHYSRFTDEQRGRCLMLPGVTGLAQTNGRNTLPWSQRIALDLKYIEEYSLWLDLKILVRTVVVVFTAQGIVLDRNPEQVDDIGLVTRNYKQ